jgi:hypothetical protein
MKAKTLYIIILSLAIFPIRLRAQSDSSSYQNSYEKFKEQAQKEYNDFVAKAQNEFEEFLAQAWSEYQSFAGQSGAFSKQKPEVVPTIGVQSGIIDVEAPSLDNESPVFETEPESRNSIFDYDTSPSSNVKINFYGRDMVFNVPKTLRVTSHGVKERHVSQFYATLHQNDTEHVLQRQLDAAVSEMGLNEWGYFALLRTITEKLYANTNDRVLFSFYMLHSHGFKARVGRGSKSNRLLLLLALDNHKEVYSKTFFRINGTKYYAVYGNGLQGESVYSYDEKADDSGLKEIRLDFTKTLNIATCDKSRKLHLNKVNLDITLPYSTANLRYYDEIPTTVFPIYFNTPVSKETEAVLAQTFSSLSKQYNKVQLVDIMLNFVQTAFVYKIDEQYHGREKYYFPEETIGLPYSDCEDRCALFGWMVKRFVGYDIIGVLYDDHMATAVCFGNDAQLKGKSVSYGGKGYMVCDPTYQNAAIGTVMPKFANVKCEIVKIN